jgi:hypothetical protein
LRFASRSGGFGSHELKLHKLGQALYLDSPSKWPWQRPCRSDGLPPRSARPSRCQQRSRKKFEESLKEEVMVGMQRNPPGPAQCPGADVSNLGTTFTLSMDSMRAARQQCRARPQKPARRHEDSAAPRTAVAAARPRSRPASRRWLPRAERRATVQGPASAQSVPRGWSPCRGSGNPSALWKSNAPSVVVARGLIRFHASCQRVACLSMMQR